VHVGVRRTLQAQHGRLDEGALSLTKPFRKAELGRMVRLALDGTPAVAIAQIA
jgi:hypothetical protein